MHQKVLKSNKYCNTVTEIVCLSLRLNCKRLPSRVSSINWHRVKLYSLKILFQVELSWSKRFLTFLQVIAKFTRLRGSRKDPMCRSISAGTFSGRLKIGQGPSSLAIFDTRVSLEPGLLAIFVDTSVFFRS
jgi:hypothetical protein